MLPHLLWMAAASVLRMLLRQPCRPGTLNDETLHVVTLTQHSLTLSLNDPSMSGTILNPMDPVVNVTGTVLALQYLGFAGRDSHKMITLRV